MQVAYQIAAAQAQARQAFGVPIVYSRGDGEVSLMATVGRSDFPIDSAEGPVLLRTVDFLIAAGSIVFGSGGPTEPERADRITATIGEVEETYEVLPTEGTQPWRWSDPAQQQYRVHTQKIA